MRSREASPVHMDDPPPVQEQVLFQSLPGNVRQYIQFQELAHDREATEATRHHASSASAYLLHEVFKPQDLEGLIKWGTFQASKLSPSGS